MFKIKRTLPSHLLTIIAMGCCSLYSCKKNVKALEPPVVDSIPTIVLPNPELKHYVPVLIKYNSQTISLSYLKQSAVLSEIKYSDGKSDRFVYNANQQLINYEKYSNDVLFYSVDYLRNKDGVVIKVNQFKVNDKLYELTGHIALTYNLSSQIAGIKRFNQDDLLKSEQANDYYTTSDISKKTVTGSDKVIKVTTFMYDSKNGIFKYIKNLDLLSLEASDNFFASGSNNITSMMNDRTATLNQRFTYSYNDNGYPLKYISTDASGEKSFTVSYIMVN
jgi:hypothetical protein